MFQPANKIAALTMALLTALLPSAKPEDDYSDTFIKSSFLCADKLSMDKKEFAVFRSTIDVSKLSPTSTRSGIIASINKWINDKPTIMNGDDQYTVLSDSSCMTVLYSLDQPLCAYNGITVGDTAGIEMPATGSDMISVLGAVLGVAIAAIAVLGLIVVVLGVAMYCGRKSRIMNRSRDVTDGKACNDEG